MSGWFIALANGDGDLRRIGLTIAIVAIFYFAFTLTRRH